jgi:uncharacterized surface anchored protein
MTLLARCRWIIFALSGLLLVQAVTVNATQNRASAAQQGEVETRTFKIAGTAVNAVTGEPLYQARISLADTKNRRQVIWLTTSENGRFEFSNLRPGKYSLQGAKRGFISAAYEQHEQFSTAIVTGPEFSTEELRLRLMPMALISGHVFDEYGDPVRSARVGLYLESHGGGMSRIVHLNNANSDDRGFFDFSLLRTGKYFVSVTADPWYAVHPISAQTGAPTSLDVTYPTTYYSGSTESAGATPIEVKGGEKLQIDVHLNPEPALHIVFRLPQNDVEQRNYSVIPTLEKRIFDSEESVQSEMRPLVDGAYELVGVAPGRYTVRTRDRSTGQQGLSRDIDLVRNQQELDSSHSEPLGSLQLTLKMPGDEPVNKVNGVALQDSDRRVVAFRQTDATGQFSFEDLASGKYAILINSSVKPYAVMRISSPGGEYSGHEVNITPGTTLELSASLSVGMTSIEGVVHKKGKAVSGVMVALVPKDPEAHVELFRRDQSDFDGTFLLPSVIPGSYTVIAVQDAWGFEWLKPGVLAKYVEQGQELTIGELMRGVVRLPQPVEVQER